MEHRFDRFAKAVAGAVSRRDALVQVGRGMLVAGLAAVGLAVDSPTTGDCMHLCADCCRNLNPPPRGDEMAECIRQCHAGEGSCGPAFTVAGCTPRW